MAEKLWLFFVMFATKVFFAVFGKTIIFLGNPDTPVERSKKKKTLINALVQKLQLDEHRKFRCYVMFVTICSYIH
jgi:hypothetical protein